MKNQVKKTAKILLVLFLLTVLFAGCGKKADETADTAASAAAAVSQSPVLSPAAGQDSPKTTPEPTKAAEKKDKDSNAGTSNTKIKETTKAPTKTPALTPTQAPTKTPQPAEKDTTATPTPKPSKTPKPEEEAVNTQAPEESSTARPASEYEDTADPNDPLNIEMESENFIEDPINDWDDPYSPGTEHLYDHGEDPFLPDQPSDNTPDQTPDSRYCQISIDCFDILDHAEDFTGDWNRVGDGLILGTVSVELYENDTVYDILWRACSNYSISMGVRNSAYGNYIESINGISEFEAGPTSGWTYYVNGSFAQTSSDTYPVSNGDSIEWKYSCTY